MAAGHHVVKIDKHPGCCAVTAQFDQDRKAKRFFAHDYFVITVRSLPGHALGPWKTVDLLRKVPRTLTMRGWNAQFGSTENQVIPKDCQKRQATVELS